VLEDKDKPEFIKDQNGKEIQIGGYDPRGIELKHLVLFDEAWNYKYPSLKGKKAVMGFGQSCLDCG